MTMPKLGAIHSSSLVLSFLISNVAVRGSDIHTPNVFPDLTNLSLPSASSSVIMPPGCLCKKTGTSSATCDVFSCNCPCDLTAAACDANCCCDPECPRSALVFNSTCTQEFQTLTARSHVKMCFENRTGLEHINPSFPIRVSDTIEVRFHLFCVVWESMTTQPEKLILYGSL